MNVHGTPGPWDRIEHVAIAVNDAPSAVAFARPKAEEFGPLKTHRDGTRSTYVRDPSGNSVEIMAAD